jgi:hypothetical protein
VFLLLLSLDLCVVGSVGCSFSSVGYFCLSTVADRGSLLYCLIFYSRVFSLSAVHFPQSLLSRMRLSARSFSPTPCQRPAALPRQAGARVPSSSAAEPRGPVVAAPSVGGEPQASSSCLHRPLQPPVPRRGFWVHHHAAATAHDGGRLHGRRLGHRLESARQVRRVSALQPRRRHDERGWLPQPGAGISG